MPTSEYPTPRGPTILELLWERLDGLTWMLMNKCEATAIFHSREEVVGEAKGVAWCIAMMRNPIHPNMDAVRAEAMERYGKAMERHAKPEHEEARPTRRRRTAT